MLSKSTSSSMMYIIKSFNRNFSLSYRTYNKDSKAFIGRNDCKNVYMSLRKIVHSYSIGNGKGQAFSASQDKLGQATSSTKENQPQIIQVSLQEFNKVKHLLKQLKQQISDLQIQQNQGKSSKNNSRQNSLNQNQIKNGKSGNLSQKISQFTKESQIPHKISTQLEQQGQGLFFKSKEQQLSFKLIKLNIKEQFGQVIEQCLCQFRDVQNKVKRGQLPKQAIVQSLNLLYLIFYRYTLLQNAKFYDPMIRQLLLKITLHVNLLQERQVQKILSILNDHIRQGRFYQEEYLRSQSNHSFHKNVGHLVDEIKRNFIQSNRIHNFKSKTNQNSQILSLLSHFFYSQQLTHLPTQLKLEKFYSNDNQIPMIYNPLNLGYLFINSLKSSQKQAQISTFYDLFKSSLLIDENHFLNSQIQGKKIKLEQSLTKISQKKFIQLQYEGLVYFVQNYPNNAKNTVFDQLFSTFFINQKKNIQKFSVIKQLRIYYSLLLRQKATNLQSQYSQLLLSQLQRIIILQQTEQSVLKYQRQGIEIFEANDNIQFLHLKNIAMIFSQIGIQLFKNQRLSKVPLEENLIKNKLKQVILKINYYLNKICLQKLDIKDMFKEGNTQQKLLQKLVLSLNLFQFTVNFNILSKWSGQLSKDPLIEQFNVQLMKSLIILFFVNLRKSLSDFRLPDQEQNKTFAQQAIIMLLIGKQNKQIGNSLEFIFQSNEMRQQLVQLLKNSIGKNNQHKYYQQYMKICQQFKF